MWTLMGPGWEGLAQASASKFSIPSHILRSFYSSVWSTKYFFSISFLSCLCKIHTFACGVYIKCVHIHNLYADPYIYLYSLPRKATTWKICQLYSSEQQRRLCASVVISTGSDQRRPLESTKGRGSCSVKRAASEQVSELKNMSEESAEKTASILTQGNLVMLKGWRNKRKDFTWLK